MVMIVTAALDSTRLVLSGCGSRREMAENEDTTRSSTTTSTATTTSTSPLPPPLSSSSSPPSARHLSSKGEAADVQPIKSGLLQVSPMCNGYNNNNSSSSNNTTSPQRGREDASASNCGVTPGGGRDGEVGRNGSSPAAEKKLKEESQQTSMTVKQESDQDGPLDFSLRRRDSVSESFTDDSRASSSLSPPNYGLVAGAAQTYSSSSASLRHSPDPEHLHLPQPHLLHPQRHPHSSQPPHHHHHPHQFSGSSHGREASSDHFHKLPHLGKSPGSSPDHGELIGQPKAAPKMGMGSGGPRSPVNSSLAALGMMAEGGGSGMTPAAMAAMLGQNGGMLGSIGNLSAFMGDPRKMIGGNGGKIQRPFKAYPKEALQMPLGYLGLPGMNPFPNLDPNILQGLSVNQEEIMSMYKQQLDFLKEREKQMINISKMSSRSPPSSSTSSTPSSSSFCTSSNGSSSINSMTHPPPLPPPPPQSSISHSHAAPPSLPSSAVAAAAAAASFFPPASHSSSSSSSSSSHPSLPTHPSSAPFSHIPSPSASNNSHFPTPTVPPLVSSTSSVTGRKRPRSLPDSQKDDAYWERRRKNNDAAKRSRDARRAKEDEIAIRAALLEQENLKLRVEVAALKTETARLRCMLYNS